MSSSSMCQTVYDTVHTVVYDTVHTVSFDTVRAFDTVKVMLDSVFTIDLLNKSQEFYSNSFSDLLMVFTIFIAVVGIIVGYKIVNDILLIKRTIKKTAEKTAEETERRFKNNIDKQNQEMTRLSALVKELHEQEILNWLTQARLAKTQKQKLHSFMCFDYALASVVNHYDKTFVQYGRIALEEIRDNVSALNGSLNKVKILRLILERIEKFKDCLFKTNYSEDEEMASKEKAYVEDSLNLCTTVKLLLDQELKSLDQ